MKINNEKGEIFTTMAIVAMIILGLVFVPNDLSKAAGIQNKQNKLVQKQTSTIELLKDADGKPIRGEDGSYIVKRIEKTSDSDQQQSITLWERIKSLPFVLLLLVIAGAAGIPGFGWVFKLYRDIKKSFKAREKETKKIIRGWDAAVATIPATLAGAKLAAEVDIPGLSKKISDGMFAVLSASYDQSTKDLVRQLRAS